MMITDCKICRTSVFFQFSIFNLLFIVTLLLIVSCSSNGDEVSIEGRLLHMNQATFYIYSPDGAIDDIDTINVAGGRFEYEKKIQRPGTLVMVFPNFSQLPIFVESGTSVNIEGDAAHLREAKVEGNDVNEKFTAFREKHLNTSPKEMKKVTADYVKSGEGNTEIALWLIQQYYLTPKNADAKGAVALFNILLHRNEKNTKVRRLRNQLYATGLVAVGDKIGTFTTTDIDGNRITEKFIADGSSIVMTCASWSYDSQNMLRKLAQREGCKVVAICLDVKKEEARSLQERCNAKHVNMICDSTQWENPLLRTFGLTTVPDNVMIENGKVKKRNISLSEL